MAPFFIPMANSRIPALTELAETPASGDLIHIVDVSDTVAYCMRLINSHKTRYLLSFDEEHKFIGIVTIHDLLRQAILDNEDKFDSLETIQLINQEESRHLLI